MGHVTAAPGVFQDLLDRMDECAITVAADWRILNANPAAARLLGPSAGGPLPGKDLRQLLPPALLPALDRAMTTRMRTESTDRHEAGVANADDDCWLECRAFPASVGGLHVLIRDVTGRYQAQVAVEASERELRRIAESGIVGVLYWDIEGRITGANDAFLSSIGYTRADLEAGRIDWKALTPPEHLATDAVRIAELLANGMHRPHEKEYIRRDGTRVLVLIASTFFLNSSRRGISICIDLSEQRRIAAERDAARDLFDRFVDGSPIGFALFDRELRCIRANRAGAKGVGRKPEELVGLRMRDIIPVIAEQAEPLMQRVLDSGEPVHQFEIVGPTPVTGHARVWITSFFPVRDSRGEVVGVGSTAMDVTDRRRSEEALRESERMAAVGQLAGGVAHEVNNALQGVIGFADFALAEESLNEQTRDDLIQIRRAADRAAIITRQLLAFGRRQVRDAVRLDARQLLLDFAPILRQALGTGRELVLDLPAETDRAWVMADRGQLEQVLLNLTLNSRDATAQGSAMTWRVRSARLDATALAGLGRPDLHPGGYIRFEAVDTGNGMDEETRARAFEPFFTTKPIGKGTGLGLSVAYGIVRQSGGHIAIASVPGRGTTITILMPEARSRTAQRAPEPAAPQLHLPLGATALAVDDDAAVLALIARMLRSHGFEVTTASNGQEALRELGSRRFDLVVTDVAMPELDGLAVARTAEAKGGTPVLFVSGWTPEELAQRGLEGAGAVLQKPFTPDDFARAVAPLLARARR
jgi:PAS domain S-box-containing protein